VIDPGAASASHDLLLRPGVRLEYATLAWNVVGCTVLLAAALDAGSVALAGFGVDPVIEIVASSIVVWQLRGVTDDGRERAALRCASSQSPSPCLPSTSRPRAP